MRRSDREITKKYNLIARDNRASFEMDCAHRLVTDEEQGNCTMEYKSVMGRGSNTPHHSVQTNRRGNDREAADERIKLKVAVLRSLRTIHLYILRRSLRPAFE